MTRWASREEGAAGGGDMGFLEGSEGGVGREGGGRGAVEAVIGSCWGCGVVVDGFEAGDSRALDGGWGVGALDGCWIGGGIWEGGGVDAGGLKVDTGPVVGSEAGAPAKGPGWLKFAFICGVCAMRLEEREKR